VPLHRAQGCGFTGAVVATVGIYLPPALLMVASTRALEFIKKSQAIRAALRGIRPAVVGMIAAAAFTVGGTAPHHWVSLLIFAAALVALMRLRVQVAWVIRQQGLQDCCCSDAAVTHGRHDGQARNGSFHLRQTHPHG